MSEWQPIETAPKDGTRILLGYYYFQDEGGGSQLVAFWHQTHRMWCSTYQLFVDDSPFAPTHWMPLPPPPKEPQ
jgi:hypothetical protein